MPIYHCRECRNFVEMPAGSGPKRRKCDACGASSITEACRASDSKVAGPDTSTSKRARVGIVGRSNGAPEFKKWPLATMNPAVTYVASLKDAKWTDVLPGESMRFAFNLLDMDNPDQQGLIIKLPVPTADLAVQKHFNAVTKHMVKNCRVTDCTEAVGEAAAALAVLQHHPGFKMKWGFHQHSGPGIDQIWVIETAGRLTDVLLVEAKGPEAKEAENRWSPPGFEQMSERWVIHNLATMFRGGSASVQGPLASSILTGLGVKVGLAYPAPGGSSKNYYGTVELMPAGRTINLQRITVQAVWQPDGMLSFRKFRRPDLTSFEVADLSHYEAAHRRYPSSYPSADRPVFGPP